MKIYIPSILPICLKNKLDKLFQLFEEIKQEIKYEIISKEFGLIVIENEKIFQIESTFQTNYELIKNYSYMNYDLLVDRTINNKIAIKSQLPVEYINSKLHIIKFKTNKKSNLSLVVSCFEELNNFELIKIPVDFYFEYNNDILDLKDSFFQEEFNMFLSALN